MDPFEGDPRLRVALTGGIASGKSLAADAFRARGAAVIDADEAARAVTAPGTPGLRALVERCGAPLAPDGALDRRALRHRMFAEPELRGAVEALLHPLILAELGRAAARTAGPYLLCVMPLLVERGLGPLFDRVVVVDLPEPSQLARLRDRDGEVEAAARRILAAQAPREGRLAQADDVIDNSGAPGDLVAAVDRLHRRYLELAAAPPFPRRGRGGENGRT